MQKNIIPIILLSSIFIAWCSNTTINTNNLDVQTWLITSQTWITEIITWEILSWALITWDINTWEVLSWEVLSWNILSWEISSWITTNSWDYNKILQAKLKAMVERRNKEIAQEAKSWNQDNWTITEKDIQLLENIIEQIITWQKK